MTSTTKAVGKDMTRCPHKEQKRQLLSEAMGTKILASKS